MRVAVVEVVTSTLDGVAFVLVAVTALACGAGLAAARRRRSRVSSSSRSCRTWAGGRFGCGRAASVPGRAHRSGLRTGVDG